MPTYPHAHGIPHADGFTVTISLKLTRDELRLLDLLRGTNGHISRSDTIRAAILIASEYSLLRKEAIEAAIIEREQRPPRSPRGGGRGLRKARRDRSDCLSDPD